MARDLERGSSEYLEGDQADATATPISMSALVQTESTGTGTAIGIVDKDVTNHRFLLLVGRGGGSDSVSAFVDAGGGTSTEAVGGALTVGTPHHIGASFESATSRYSFLDGTKSSQDTGNVTPTGMDRTSIGRSGDSTPSAYFDGLVSEVGIWDVTLTDAEFAWLAKGASPLTLVHRLDNLVNYQDLIRSINRPGIGATLTATGTVVAAHPRVLYPAPLLVPPISAAAAAGADVRQHIISAYYRLSAA